MASQPATEVSTKATSRPAGTDVAVPPISSSAPMASASQFLAIRRLP